MTGEYHRPSPAGLTPLPRPDALGYVHPTMSFRLHDSLSNAVIPLPQRTPGEASLYVCGPTVYGYIHVGNARPPVVFDVLVRHLERQGTIVRYVRNYTDVDDKIIQVALDTGEDPRAVSDRFIAAYREDMAALVCRPPWAEPRVSENIGGIIELTGALLAKGHAYVTPAGDVYYDAASFQGYGKLSKRQIDQQCADEGRGKTGEGKRNEHDFALWKAAKPHEPEGARWPSPWGDGRPGWHIECSAMAHALLGDGFDVHGGGQDLKFPHHENEIAQSEPVYGPMASAWMHNGFIEVDIERNANFSEEAIAELPALKEGDPELRKVSKSDPKKLQAYRERDPATLTPADRTMIAVLERKVHFGHWFQLRRLRERVDGEAVRLWILGTHYRAPLAFDLAEADDDVSFPAIDQAEKRLEYFYDTRIKLAAKRAAGVQGKPNLVETMDKLVRDFDAALDDDLNTAGALDPFAQVFTLTNKLCDAKRPDLRDLDAAGAAIAHVTAVLGVGEGEPEAFFERVTARRVRCRKLDPARIDDLVRQRTAAREGRDFSRADEIRAELTALGIELRDGASGTAWRAV